MLTIDQVQRIVDGVLAVTLASNAIHEASDFTVAKKADGSPVSNLDNENQCQLVELLNVVAPGLPILAEEDDTSLHIKLDAGIRTYATIDPIDGTSPCAAGYKHNWNVAVGIVENGIPVLGVVGMPVYGQVVVGGSLVGGVYTISQSGVRTPVTRVENANKLWGMDMAPTVACDPFLVELNRRLVADHECGGYPTNVPSIQSGLDLTLGRTRFFVTANAKIWDIVPIAAFASALGYHAKHIDGGALSLVPPHRDTLQTVLLADGADTATKVSAVYVSTARLYQQNPRKDLKGDIQFAGRYVTLTTEQTPTVTYERVYVRDGVTVIVVPAQGILRFIRETDWESGRVEVKPVTGYCEDGEDPLVCAKRELAEELGLVAGEWAHYLDSRWQGATIHSQHYFVARELREVAARPDHDETIHGHVDMTREEVKQAALDLTFGTNENAFALLRFVS